MAIKISNRNALKIIAKNTPSIIYSAIMSLSATDPNFSILFALALSMINAWGEFGQARVNELVSDLNNNKERFVLSVTSSDKFKSIFLNILERHMKESSESKRQLFRNYLVAVASGKNTSFDNHTKLFLILDQITTDEIRLFMLLPTIIEDSQGEFIKLGGQPRKEIFINEAQIKLRLINWYIDEQKISELLMFLNNYGLIVIQDRTSGVLGGGGKNHVVFTGLTESGNSFYDYIGDETFDKTIISLS